MIATPSTRTHGVPVDANRASAPAVEVASAALNVPPSPAAVASLAQAASALASPPPGVHVVADRNARRPVGVGAATGVVWSMPRQ